MNDAVEVNQLACSEHKKEYLWRIQPHLAHIRLSKLGSEIHAFSLIAIINCRRRIAEHRKLNEPK